MLVAAAMLNESYASLICGSWYASNMEHINHQEQISFKACLSSLTTSRNLLIWSAWCCSALTSLRFC